jgi:NADP-dependent 3-hydroxy acid dehydrogenase YdfG
MVWFRRLGCHDWHQRKRLIVCFKAIIPQMIERIRSYQHRFHCCKEVYPNGNVYCATKHGWRSRNAYGFKPVRN